MFLETTMSLEDNIRAVRKTKGWSQRVLAEHIESDASYVNRVEAGKINPSIGSLTKIADALGCTIDQLVRNNDIDVQVNDKPINERIRLIEELEEEDKSVLFHMINTMLTNKRMRELLKQD